MEVGHGIQVIVEVPHNPARSLGGLPCSKDGIPKPDMFGRMDLVCGRRRPGVDHEDCECASGGGGAPVFAHPSQCSKFKPVWPFRPRLGVAKGVVYMGQGSNTCPGVVRLFVKFVEQKLVFGRPGFGTGGVTGTFPQQMFL